MEYIAALNQRAMVYIVNNNPTLQDIHFNNNHISYGNTVIDLGNFNLMTLLDDYSSFKEDITLMSPEDFIDIVSVHVLGIRQIETHGQDKNLRDNFYRVLSSLPVGYKKENIVNGYNAFVYDMLCYQDYLTPEVNPLLQEFQNKMEEIAISDEPTKIQDEELQSYYRMQEEVKSFQEKFKQEKETKLMLTLPQEKAGYVNAFGIALTISIIGIIIASLVFIYAV